MDTETAPIPIPSHIPHFDLILKRPQQFSKRLGQCKFVLSDSAIWQSLEAVRLNSMYNKSIDLDSLREVKHFTPLFEKYCFAAPCKSPSREHREFSAGKWDRSFIKTQYIIISSTKEVRPQIFECQHICPFYIAQEKTLIEVKGENLWDFYRSRKGNSIIYCENFSSDLPDGYDSQIVQAYQRYILTEEQIWQLLVQVISALRVLSEFGYSHTHLREYAIYRVSDSKYQLVFHPEIDSMVKLAHSSRFYWYDFYITPEDLSADEAQSKETELQTVEREQRSSVFSLGMVILNIMNPEDFNRDIYSRKNYEVDRTVIDWKLNNARGKYSTQLIETVASCLKLEPQRAHLRQLQLNVREHMQKLRDRLLQTQIVVNDLLKMRSKSRVTSGSQIRSKHSLSPKRHEGFDSSVRNAGSQQYSSDRHSDKRHDSSESEGRKSSRSGTPGRKSNSQGGVRPSKTLSNEQLVPSTRKSTPSRHSSARKNDESELHTNPSSRALIKSHSKNSERAVRQVESITEEVKTDDLPGSNTNPTTSMNVTETDPQKTEGLSSTKYRISQEGVNNQKWVGNAQVPKTKPIQGGQKASSRQNLRQLEISFERGTFGGDSLESPKFKNSLSNKLRERQSLLLDSNHNRESEASGHRQSLQSEGHIEHKNTVTNKKVFQENSQVNRNQSSDNPCIETRRKLFQGSDQLEKSTPVKLQSDVKARKDANGCQDIQSLSDQFEELEHSKDSILESWKDLHYANLKQITLELSDCLQPIQTLQKNLPNGVWINGDIYYGNFKGGRRSGVGLEVFPEGEYYFGEFQNDLFHGQGFYSWNSKEFFLGLYENGKKTYGTLKGPKIEFEGEFRKGKKMNGLGKAVYLTGQTFVGYWQNGKKHGRGIMTQVSGDLFIGNWEKGKRKGPGIYRTANFPQEGRQLKGIWVNSQIQGDAYIQFENGKTYEGSICDLEMHGKGIYRFSKSSYCKGTFYHGEATHGEIRYQNGQTYLGRLKKMKRHGYGQYHYSDGTVKKGNWVEGVRIEKSS